MSRLAWLSPLWLSLLWLGCSGSDPRPAPVPAGGRLVVLISIDGFHPDYLDRPWAPRLRALARSGVRAERLIPAFPTKTFPNHYTIATGLFPEHHGIVANAMVDPELGRFTAADTAINLKPGWWGGEPIWITAERQGLRTATMFWVGSQVAFDGRRPRFWHHFDPALPNATRVEEVLRWISLPADQRPRLVTLYLNRVDVMGHRHGPHGAGLDSAVAVVDSAVGRVIDGIAKRGLRPTTDVVIVSDHGMTEISPERVIYLDDYLAIDPSEIVDLSPVTAIEPKGGRTGEVYRALADAHPRLRVYRREEMPERFRFRSHPRITPIVAIADDGWTISTRARWRTHPLLDRGNHGYDNLAPSMAAIFIGSGPSFRSGVVVPPFQNVHVYPLLAHLLDIVPAPNDGSLDSVRSVLR